jgi:hypothetical protein
MTLKQRTFLAAYSKVGIISEAARKAKVDRKSHTNWLRDEEYRLAFADAKEEAIELLEANVRRRAMRARKPSDLLAIFLLKAARPEVYRDNARVELGNGANGPLQIEVTFVKPNGGNGE